MEPGQSGELVTVVLKLFFRVRQSTSITGCVRRSVGRLVGWSVGNDDPHVAPIGFLGLVHGSITATLPLTLP